MALACGRQLLPPLLQEQQLHDARPVLAGSSSTRLPSSSSSLQHRGFRQSSRLQTLSVVRDLELEILSFAMSPLVGGTLCNVDWMFFFVAFCNRPGQF